MEDKEFLDEQFEHAIESQFMPLVQAETLKYCGEIIYERIQDDLKRDKNNQKVTDLTNIFAMKTVGLLYSFALENLLKAVIKKQKGSLFINGTYDYKTHKLKVLADKTGLNFSEGENRLLIKLTKNTKQLFSL